MRSHPPTLITLVRGTLARECNLPPGARILLAVSGGTDSTALLHVLAGLQETLRFTLFAHGVDHGLRGEAASELEQAGMFAATLGVPWSTTRLAIAPGGNLQARAREGRFEALAAACEQNGATFLATAHHADDRAETVMMRLLRGTGPRGLGVLPPREAKKLRPMIRATRADVEAHIARHGLNVAHDPSNRDPRFLRTRVRAELMPLMTQLNPGAVAHLCALSDEASRSTTRAELHEATPNAEHDL